MLPQEQFGMGSPDQTQHSPMSLREQLMSLLPKMSMGRGSAMGRPRGDSEVGHTVMGQRVHPNGPMTDADVEALMAAENGPMTDADVEAMPQQRPRRMAPQQDQAGLDALMMQLSNPGMGITEGQNANIGDDSRARALAQVAALRG